MSTRTPRRLRISPPMITASTLRTSAAWTTVPTALFGLLARRVIVPHVSRSAAHFARLIVEVSTSSREDLLSASAFVRRRVAKQKVENQPFRVRGIGTA